MTRVNLVCGIAFVSVGLSTLGCGGSPEGGGTAPAVEEAAAPAESPAADATPAGGAATAAGAPEARPKFVAPVRGVAEIAYLKPDTKVIKGEVVTKIKIQNRANGAIAGLKVDETWYDKDGNPISGDSQRVRQPLLPGEVTTIELRSPRNPRMDRNNYTFTHANGDIKATLVKEITDPNEKKETTEG